MVYPCEKTENTGNSLYAAYLLKYYIISPTCHIDDMNTNNDNLYENVIDSQETRIPKIDNQQTKSVVSSNQRIQEIADY